MLNFEDQCHNIVGSWIGPGDQFLSSKTTARRAGKPASLHDREEEEENINKEDKNKENKEAKTWCSGVAYQRIDNEVHHQSAKRLECLQLCLLILCLVLIISQQVQGCADLDDLSDGALSRPEEADRAVNLAYEDVNGVFWSLDAPIFLAKIQRFTRSGHRMVS